MYFDQTMSLLAAPGFLLRSARSHDTIHKGQRSNDQSLRTRSSIANLVRFARQPLENVGEAFEDWYDGSTKDQRVERQNVEDRKQLLSVKLRTVGQVLSPRDIVGLLTLKRQPAGQIGRQLPLSSMNSKATISGKLSLILQNMTHPWSRHA